MKLADAINAYIEQKVPNTRRSYRAVWRQWKDSCPRIQRPKLEDCQRYLSYLKSTNKSDSTIRHRYQVLNSFYEFLVSLEIVRVNPWRAAGKLFSWRQHKQVRPTKRIDNGGVGRMFDAKEMWSGKAGKRDLAIFALLFGCGLRASEVLQLNIGDVMLTPDGFPYLELKHSKAGKVQKQPIPGWAWNYFADLVSQRNGDGAENEAPLFVFYYADGRPRGRMDYRTLARMYKKRCAVQGIEGVAPHSARATFASQLLEQGFQDREVADALRHSSDRQVKVYDKREREVKGNVGLEVNYKK